MRVSFKYCLVIYTMFLILSIVLRTIGPEDFVKKSFEFLLKRENKDSILKEFNIKQIKLN
jgi:hypothetical protein